MREMNCHPLAIAKFSDFYTHFSTDQKKILNWNGLSRLKKEELTPYSETQNRQKTGHDFLEKIAVLKLNGGGKCQLKNLI